MLGSIDHNINKYSVSTLCIFMYEFLPTELGLSYILDIEEAVVHG